MHTIRKTFLYTSALVSISMSCSGQLAAASVSRHEQTASGLEGWRVEDRNIRIELNPLLRDQVRAFYLGRGFSEALTESIANACVYQTIIENVSAANPPAQLEVDLADWRISGEGVEERPLVSKEEWTQRWALEGAGTASLIAFKWATFPTKQYYKLSGDYGWGMILFGGQAGERFDVDAVWRVDGEVSEQRITGLYCPD